MKPTEETLLIRARSLVLVRRRVARSRRLIAKLERHWREEPISRCRRQRRQRRRAFLAECGQSLFVIEFLETSSHIQMCGLTLVTRRPTDRPSGRKCRAAKVYSARSMREPRRISSGRRLRAGQTQSDEAGNNDVGCISVFSSRAKR